MYLKKENITKNRDDKELIANKKVLVIGGISNVQ